MSACGDRLVWAHGIGGVFCQLLGHATRVSTQLSRAGCCWMCHRCEEVSWESSRTVAGAEGRPWGVVCRAWAAAGPGQGGGCWCGGHELQIGCCVGGGWWCWAQRLPTRCVIHEARALHVTRVSWPGGTCGGRPPAGSSSAESMGAGMMGTGQVMAQAAVALAGVAMVGNCGSQVRVLV